MKTAILGGGLTGLTVGNLLNEKGSDFEILEKENHCGGLMCTLQEDGFSFDYGGSHIIFSKNQEALSFLLNLLEDNKTCNKRNTKVLYKGCYVKYPFENGLADLPKEDNYECLYEFIQNLLRNKGLQEKPANLKEWFLTTFGKAIAEKYLIPYNEKIWKYPVEDMGLNWVERIPRPPVEDIIKSSLGMKTEGYTHQLNFYYPINGGIEAIITGLEKTVSPKVVKNFNIKKISFQNKKWIISDGHSQKEYDKLVSTIPIHELIAALDDVPANIQNAVKELKYNSLITVMIGLNKNKPNDLSWLYIPDKSVITHRVSFPSNYSPCVAPQGKSSVLAEITCNKDDAIWETGDETLGKRVVADLNRLGLINKKDVCFLKIKRLEYAYVISDLKYDSNLSLVQSFLEQKGIQVLGRFAEFKYYNMDDCVTSVMKYFNQS